MKIVIVGAGEVGRSLCASLSDAGHDVTLIETSSSQCERLDEEQNARIVNGNGSSARQLVDVGVGKCGAFLAMTSDDRTNVISCSLAKGLGAKNTVARIHDETFNDTSVINYQLHFGIDQLINPEAICAVELAKQIRNPGRVAVENFARGQIEVQQLRVNEGSKLVNRNLRDVKLSRRVRVGYLQRNNETEVAGADTQIRTGDLVTLFGHPEELLDVRDRFDPKDKVNTTRVVVFGASETTIALIRILSNPRFKIRVIEKDPERCQELARRFPKITFINGDATSLRLLEEEQIGGADYFVACTKDDEENIMTCVQASKLGARHVQLVINKGDYEEILETLKSTLQIEVVVSPRGVMAETMRRMLSEAPVTELARLPAGKGRILEVNVGHKSPCVGRLIKDIELPPGCLFVALMHKFQGKVPSADDKILAGDRLAVIAQDEHEKDLLKRLV